MTPLRVVKAFACRCERCGYEWQAAEKPDRCAGCRSPYWNVKRGVLRRGRPKSGRTGKAGRGR